MTAPVVLAGHPAGGVGLVRLNHPGAGAIEMLPRCMDAPLGTSPLLETKAIQMLFASQNQEEGMAAFIGKRKPKCAGR
ncbi:MAG: hypothetical protein ABL891_23345 [Burkholderiales bacterium]